MRKSVLTRAKFFSRDKKGATMVEYAILVGVIAFVAIVGATTFGSDLSTKLSAMGTTISGINSSAGTSTSK
jgi:pilus assembly protein Flp/PilA